jgi:hypothetical protein
VALYRVAGARWLAHVLSTVSKGSFSNLPFPHRISGGNCSINAISLAK